MTINYHHINMFDLLDFTLLFNLKILCVDRLSSYQLVQVSKLHGHVSKGYH